MRSNKGGKYYGRYDKIGWKNYHLQFICMSTTLMRDT